MKRIKFPHEKGRRISSNLNTWPGYEKKQLKIISQCVACKRNYDNGCPYPMNKQPKCRFREKEENLNV